MAAILYASREKCMEQEESLYLCPAMMQTCVQLIVRHQDVLSPLLCFPPLHHVAALMLAEIVSGEFIIFLFQRLA